MNNEKKYSDGIEISGLMSLSPGRVKKQAAASGTDYYSLIFSHQNAQGRAAFYLHTILFESRQTEYFDIIKKAYNEWNNLPKESRGKIRPYFYIKGHSNAFFTIKAYLTMEITYLDYLGLYTLTDAQTLTITVKDTTE